MNENPDRLILMTGGLDTYIIWRLEGQPKGVFFDFGHPANVFERQSLERIEAHFQQSFFRVIQKEDLSGYEMENGYMPFRNLFLFLWASLEYPNAEIFFGQVLEWLPDKNPGFYRLVERLAADLGKRRLRVLAPYKNLTKTQMVARFLAAGHPASELTELTYSCLNSVSPPCGQCFSCMDRYIAFTNNGFGETLQSEPTRADWYREMKARRMKFKPRYLVMYARRLLEGHRAFRKIARGQAPSRIEGIRHGSGSRRPRIANRSFVPSDARVSTTERE